MTKSSSVDNITKLKGQWVKINLGGPESRSGRLLDVDSDYLVIQTHKDEVVYYQLSHIKGVSINANDFSKGSRKVKHIHGDHFIDILKHFKRKKIKVNRGGPESIEGVLNGISKGYIELTVGDDIVFLAIYHIKSVSAAKHAKFSSGKKSSGKKKSSRKHSSGKKKSSGKHSSGKKGSSGKRSSGKHSSGKKKSSGKHSSGKHSSGKKSSGHKSSGRKHSSGKRGKSSRVYTAVKEVYRSGNEKYMFNDPYETSKGSKRSSGYDHDFVKRARQPRPLTSLERKGWFKLN